MQDVRDRDAWEDWVVYMLTSVEQTATRYLDALAEGGVLAGEAMTEGEA